jgi:lipopolysaccharide/colanic/teichoic acid biosynthesis glycosyltransferase
MVRLDIRYSRDWSLGLDLKIILETPRAVFFGGGAY